MMHSAGPRDFNVVCEVDEPTAIGNLVRAGLGVAFVGACKGDAETPLIKLRIDRPVCQRTFHIAWLENRYLSRAALQFRDFLVRHFAKLQ
nr:LysR substrate-binding domain-containing protein [Paenibacillus sp. 32O-W]